MKFLGFFLVAILATWLIGWGAISALGTTTGLVIEIVIGIPLGFLAVAKGLN